jgi:hypothetical protein
MKLLLILLAIYLIWKFAAGLINFVIKFALVAVAILLVVHLLK